MSGPDDLAKRLKEVAGDDAIACALAPVLAEPAGKSTSGYAYLAPRAWARFRDGVPHLFLFGERVLEAADKLAAWSEEVKDAASVVRQVVLTAAITAPPDFWLLRHVLGFFAELGLTERLVRGDAIDPETEPLHAGELDKDFMFLLSRGMVEQYEDAFRIAGHPRVRAIMESVRPVEGPATLTPLWRKLFRGEALTTEEQDLLTAQGKDVPRRTDPEQNHWIPDFAELEIGYRLVPLVLGLRGAERTRDLAQGGEFEPASLSTRYPFCVAAALDVLAAAGWVKGGGEYLVTSTGARGFSRGPGPFGIIETYHPYMAKGAEILRSGPSNVWVTRSENVGASQDANRATFHQANDALDKLVKETGFSYQVFIEHAIGRGEATRQRYERSKGALTYVGADLEDAAIDAAMAEQKKGVLPQDMLFVRSADIGKPDALLSALHGRGIDPNGAVMLVGNGFHEVRDQTDEGMVLVFKGYHDAGILLLFTEENALSIDDLRATAYNTYHAGFRYVHDKSGQGLRPADPNPKPPRLGHPLRAAWSECAKKAGYVRADAYSTRTRTVYPYTPKSGHNPSISVNHFFVPRAIADKLGLRP